MGFPFFALGHNGALAPIGAEYSGHPFHHGIVRIDLFHDPAIVNIIGS